MSREELVREFEAGRMTRQAFMRKLALMGGALGVALVGVQSAMAQDVDTTAKKAPPKKTAAKKPLAKKAPAKKATGKKPLSKKAPAKKAPAKKPTIPPGLDEV